mgnify:CR=1 FL=1
MKRVWKNGNTAIILLYGIMGFILGPVSYVIAKALIGYLKTVIERDKIKKYEQL